MFYSGSYYDAVVRRVELEEIHMIGHSQHSRTNFDSDLCQGCEFSLAQIWLLSLLNSTKQGTCHQVCNPFGTIRRIRIYHGEYLKL